MIPLDRRTRAMLPDFVRLFGGEPTYLAIAPGRVNLIGEHTDYNEGFVLPAALDRDVRVLFRPRGDRRVRLYALEFDNLADFHLDRLEYDDRIFWSNYARGAAWALEQRGLRLRGVEGVVSGNVPRGSGLSSSAALEVACAKAFLTAADALLAFPGPELAQATQQAENEFVGVHCGIMDQFISVLAQAGHALLIDCRSLDYRRVPFPPDAALVIGNTKVSRSLAASAYNERRAQCEEGVRRLRSRLPHIRSLRDVSPQVLEAHSDLLPEVIYRRCRHVVTENARVLETVQAMERQDLSQMGRLMDASHASLRDDYQVSSEALDAMVEAMRRGGGCYGARLTGAGFGGCAVALVQAGREKEVQESIYRHYSRRMRIWPEVYVTAPGQGARVLPLWEGGGPPRSRRGGARSG